MRCRQSGGPLAIALLLVGCAHEPAPPPNRAEFESLRQVLATRPAARARVEAECRDDMTSAPRAERDVLAAVLDLDADEVARTFCARYVAGIVRGDVTYADFVAMRTGSSDPELLRRFLRALRLDPSAVAI